MGKEVDWFGSRHKDLSCGRAELRTGGDGYMRTQMPVVGYTA